jgi:ABC-type sugar transport system ATPase subunit
MEEINILEIKNLNFKRDGQQILDNFNLKVKKGSIHSILFKKEKSKNKILEFLQGKNGFNNAKLIINGAKTNRKKLKNSDKNIIYLINQYSAVNPEKDPLGIFKFNNTGDNENKSTVFPEMTIAENIFFGREPLKSFLFFKAIDNQKMNDLTKNLLSLLELELYPDQKMMELSPLEKQLVEILKALSYQAKILLIDQAVVNIVEKKKSIFFDFIKKLKEKGITVVYFTQEIKEVFTSSDYVSVLKDGKNMGEYKVSNLEYNELALLLMGK